MTETLGLGASDAEPRWVGFRRHQIMLALAVLASLCGFLLGGASPGFLVLAAAAAAMVVPLPSGDTVATLLGTAVRYATRSHWSTLHALVADETVTLRHRSAVTFTPSVLDHVGRLDLSGRDRDVVAALTEVAHTMAATSAGGHLALVVEVADHETTTFLCTKDRPSLPGWRTGGGAPLRTSSLPIRVVRERWRYVATADGYLMVARLRGFTPWTDRSPLAPLQLAGVPLTVALHCRVVPQLRAMRMMGRAVHRLGSDATAVTALGFRRSARADVDLARVRAREERVAGGKALLQLAVYVVVDGPTLAAVRRRWDVIRRAYRENGLDVATGVGRQAQWFRWALPGGLEW